MTLHDTTAADRAAGPAFRRPVSPTEWLYLGAHRLGSAMALHLVVEGTGTLDPARLAAAVAAAAEACPGSRLVRRGREWIDSGRPPQLRIAPPGSVPDPELRQGTSLLEEPMDLVRGPGCEVLLLPGAAGATTLVLRAFHGVMDGHGARLWAAEVFRALRGEAPRPARSPLTDAALLARTGATGRRPVLMLDRPSPLAPPAGTAVGTAVQDTGGGRGGAARTLWRRRTLPGRYTALTARLAQAVADATGAPHARVMVPADLRRHHDGPPATGNLTLPLFLDLGAGEPWQGAQSQLLRALAGHRELADGFESALARLPLPVVAALLRTGQGVARRRDRHLASAVVSHLGRIDPADWSGGGFTARTVYALPVHAPLVPVSCVAVELPDRTELTVGFQGGPQLAEQAEGLMDRLVAALAGTGTAGGAADGSSRRPTDGGPMAAGVGTAAPADGPAAPAGGPGARADGPADAAEQADGPGSAGGSFRVPGTAGPGTATGLGVRRSGTGTAARADRSSAARGAAPAAAAPVDGSTREPATVVELFRRQAARTPDAVALDGPAGAVGYAELDRRSDAVAAELVRRGVGREAVVGLLVGRTPAGVAGLWGVLKAGAAYLPLDPQQPDARIAQLLRESGAAGCVTERRLLGRVPRGFAPDLVLTLDDVPGLPGPADAPGSAQGPDPLAGVRLPEPEPDGLAYVIHTSGSTGRPKGVQIEHRSLLAFVRWAGGLCGVDGRTRFAFLSSLSFDISCFPLFVPLLAGGAAVLVPGEPTGPALREALELHRADTFAVTPTHLDLFERYGLDLSGLRTLLVGGERFTRAAAVRAARRAGPATRIINGYGPTEAAVGCLAHVLDGTETGPVIPIGRPAPSVRVELAGPDGEPVTAPGAGTVGEILLSGVQLARGYLGRPDLTAAGFPVGADGVRRYRTGDLGRLLPDGSLEFAGRCDEQVKIAGHRVEPAEVQAALTGHPAVLAAAVTVRERPGGGSPALCAYVLAADGRVDDPGLGAELRGHLAERLPAHLVPATVVPVADFPRTVSGKTDLAALPDPWAASGAAPAAGPVPGPVAEADEVEQRVAALWADVLGVDRALIDRRSGFQQLGGDSLAVLEMLSAVGDGLLRPGEADRLLDGIGDSLGELTLGQVVAAVHRARSLRARPVRTGEVVA